MTEEELDQRLGRVETYIANHEKQMTRLFGMAHANKNAIGILLADRALQSTDPVNWIMQEGVGLINLLDKAISSLNGEEQPEEIDLYPIIATLDEAKKHTNALVDWVNQEVQGIVDRRSAA